MVDYHNFVFNEKSAIGRSETERDHCFGHLLPISTAVRLLCVIEQLYIYLYKQRLSESKYVTHIFTAKPLGLER